MKLSSKRHLLHPTAKSAPLGPICPNQTIITMGNDVEKKIRWNVAVILRIVISFLLVLFSFNWPRIISSPHQMGEQLFTENLWKLHSIKQRDSWNSQLNFYWTSIAVTIETQKVREIAASNQKEQTMKNFHGNYGCRSEEIIQRKFAKKRCMKRTEIMSFK